MRRCKAHLADAQKRGVRMSDIIALNDWIATVDDVFPHINKPTVKLLALWSFSIATLKSCSLSSVSQFVASLLGASINTARQRLRELYLEKENKRGEKRRTIDPEQCFLPLLKWIMNRWDNSHVAIAIDATNLKDRFVVLTVSVSYCSIAIPIAWKVLRTNQSGSWNSHWIRLLKTIQPAFSKDHIVLVLADRGIYSPSLFRTIASMGFHPYLRINSGGMFKPEGKKIWIPLSNLIKSPGEQWSGRVTLFKSTKSRLECTLLGCWQHDGEKPWLIATDLMPGESDPLWYGFRAWIEQMFKNLKREGWQWHRTRIESADRAERHLLAIALAFILVISITPNVEHLPDIEFHIETTKKKHSSIFSPHSISAFRAGRILLLMCLIAGKSLPKPRFITIPWDLFTMARYGCSE